jgi:hypothetical protein
MTDHTPPADPWSGNTPALGSPTLAYARSGHTQAMPIVVPGPPRRSRAVILLSVGVVVALIAGVSAYLGASFWYGWSITEPEEVMPADTAVYLRLDLSPGLGQRLALGRVAQKFPHDGDGRDITDQLKRDFLGVSPETYDRDIKPWLGDRLAAGVWAQDGTKATACTLAALAVADDAAVDPALQRVQRDQGAAAFGFARGNGYALVARCEGRTDSQAAATAALASGRTLAQLPAFRQALGELPGHRAAVAWADLALATAIWPDPSGVTIGGVKLPAGATTGQLIAGLEATDDGLDVQFRLSGTGAPPATVDVLSRLGQQPDNSAIAISTDLRGTPVAAQTGQAVATALAGGAFAALGTGLASALGSTLTVSVIADGANPPMTGYQWRLVADSESADKARALALAFGLPGLLTGVQVDTNGNTMTATSRGYQPSTAVLSNSTLYRHAMGSLDARAVVAAYIDVTKLMPSLRLTSTEAAQLKPIHAVGFTAGDDGATLAGLMRLVIP